MRPGIQKNSSDSSPGTSIGGGSFRKTESVASFRTTSSTPSKFIPKSRRVHKVLKDFSTKLLDINIFTEYLQDWVSENLYGDVECRFSSPFLIDELHTFDFALEGILFQQLLRMPYPSYASENLKEDELLALEDFLHTAAEALWHAFWHKSKPLPFYASFPRYPGSKFYTIDEAVSKGRIKGRMSGLSGAALVAKSNGMHARWDDVAEFVLFKENVLKGKEITFSSSVVCEALFYAIHILISRCLSKHSKVDSDYVVVSVIDSNFGGVVKLSGDLGKLEVDLSDPYQSIAEWIKCYGEVTISPVDRIWNKLGNVNWRDFGTLQILFATFYSMVQWSGPPRKSVASLAAKHSLRLQKRRIEIPINNNGNALVAYQHTTSNHDGEIEELESRENQNSKRSGSHLMLSPGEILILEDNKQGLKSFLIQQIIENGSDYSYVACAQENPSEPLMLLVGAHPARLEPSWEDMNRWYQVQRQTKVLNLLKGNGISSKHLPEIIASGRIFHSGLPEKQNPNPGTPILVTIPIGEPISSTIKHNYPFTAEEATRLCRDCLSALRCAKMANIMHGDICPENLLHVVHDQDSRKYGSFVLVSWGRAVLEERDSPALNLQFSSAHALQNGKLCPSSDVESLVYLIYFLCGGEIQRQDSIESALKWREIWWKKRAIQQYMGEVSPLLKAFTDYVDGICGTPYPVDYDVWLKRLDRAVDGSGKRGKMSEEVLRLRDVPESSGTSN